jgi:hypothetical protein
VTPLDALEPGPDGSYPAFPRRPDGSPDYERAGLLPRGSPPVPHRAPDGRLVLIDLGGPVIPAAPATDDEGGVP